MSALTQIQIAVLVDLIANPGSIGPQIAARLGVTGKEVGPALAALARRGHAHSEHETSVLGGKKWRKLAVWMPGKNEPEFVANPGESPEKIIRNITAEDIAWMAYWRLPKCERKRRGAAP